MVRVASIALSFGLAALAGCYVHGHHDHRPHGYYQPRPYYHHRHYDNRYHGHRDHGRHDDDHHDHGRSISNGGRGGDDRRSPRDDRPVNPSVPRSPHRGGDEDDGRRRGGRG